MAKTPPIKRARLLAQMTQTSAALELGVSQSTYQRWEAGTLPIPENKVGQIAKLFGTGKAAVMATPPPFDMSGVDNSIGNDRKYYGEVAIHFISGGTPLLMPITEAVHEDLYADLQADEPFVRVDSLDNRMVFVRREAISDIYFSSDAYHDYGPEADRYDEILGVFPDDDLWQVAAVLDDLADVDGDFDVEVLADAKAKLTLTDAELDTLIADGHVKPEDRQKVLAEVEARTEKFIAHARNVTWQMGSCRREVLATAGGQFFEWFRCLAEDHDAHERAIFLPFEGYHRTIVINPAALDYICIPAHKYREGEIAASAIELADR